jgi:hypothetical protein
MDAKLICQTVGVALSDNQLQLLELSLAILQTDFTFSWNTFSYV